MTNKAFFKTQEPATKIYIDADAITVTAKSLASKHKLTFNQAMLVITEQRMAARLTNLDTAQINKITPEKIRPGNKPNCSNRDPLKLRLLASNNTSGCTGISQVKKTSKWQAQIGHKGKVYYLGSYTDYKEAVNARKDAEKKFGFHP